VPIDREQALKRAEKFLRQGRLDAAIAEYVQVVQDNPRDWTTANLLGDLYVRANQIGDACRQYVRIAEHLATDGFVAKAAAIYKKIIKLNPADEEVLARAAELAAQQGLTADVRLFMTSAFQHRLKRGDRAGAIQLARKRVAFDPSDIVGRLDAARMFAEAGDQAGAAGELKAAGLALESQGRVADAVRPLREALRFSPGDHEIRTALLRLFILLGDLASASEVAQSGEHLRVLLADARQRGNVDVVHDLLVRIATADPGALDVRLEIARASLDRGDVEHAVRWAAVEHVAEHPALALTLGEAYFLQGRLDEGQALVGQALLRDHTLRGQVSHLVDRLAVTDATAAGAALLAAVDACVERGETAWACVRIEAFVAAVPDAVPVLRRHIDLCVDAGRNDDLPAAQLRLTDALLRLGELQEARIIAEDLVASFPDDERYRARLAEALDGLGLTAVLESSTAADLDGALSVLASDEPSPLGLEPGGSALSDDFSDLLAALASDAAARPSVVDSPASVPEPASEPDSAPEAVPPELPAFAPAAPRAWHAPDATTSPPQPWTGFREPQQVDIALDFATVPPPEPPASVPATAPAPPIGPVTVATPTPTPTPAPDPRGPAADEDATLEDPASEAKSVGSRKVDLLGVGEDLLRIFEGRPPKGEETPDRPSAEIDLSAALAGIKRDGDGKPAAPEGGAEPTLDGFFLGLRDQVAERMADAERLFREGEDAYVSGDSERAMACYRVAAREPGVRFRASWAIARIARERGQLTGAIEWLERASEVPATSPELWQSLIYELGDTLVAAGEHSRALAVFMELRAATPGYRDVDVRIRELSEGQSGWRERADGAEG
jgi:tetratricopeptide (TPR) repeat protein